MAALLTVVLIGFVVWNSIMKLRVIGLLASRAVECGTVRGYWSDYFEHCLEGEFSRWVGLGVAVPVFIVLFVAVPPIARWRERGCRIAFERLLQDLRAGKPPAVAMQAAQTFLTGRLMSSAHAASIVDAFVHHLADVTRRTGASAS